MDCVIKTVNHEGFFALYKGFVPCWLRMAPWSLTFWISFEQIREEEELDKWGHEAISWKRLHGFTNDRAVFA
jgi:hypothetical protein